MTGHERYFYDSSHKTLWLYGHPKLLSSLASYFLLALPLQCYELETLWQSFWQSFWRELRGRRGQQTMPLFRLA
jgi:transposase